MLRCDIVIDIPYMYIYDIWISIYNELESDLDYKLCSQIWKNQVSINSVKKESSHESWFFILLHDGFWGLEFDSMLPLERQEKDEHKMVFMCIDKAWKVW